MFNIKNGTALAIQQDKDLQRYLKGEKLSSKEITDIQQNLWVLIASKLAPSNLVIRQYALIDLFKNIPSHRKQILKLLNILTYKQVFVYDQNKSYKLYAEGYSYFCYTMDVLKLWIEKFEIKCDNINVVNEINVINEIIKQIEQGFIITSYLRNDIFYPAPFGDLRDQPLNANLQIPHEMKTFAISNVIFNYIESERNVWYSIKAKPIGFNTHTVKDDYYTRIVDGVPMSFNFYKGYENKYKNKIEEFKDTFSLKRLLSLIF